MQTQEKRDWETKEKVLADLKEISGKYAAYTEPAMSADGERVAIPVKNEEDEWTLCINGEPWPETFTKLWYPRFSPDERLTALVETSDGWTVAVDGKAWEETFEYVWNTQFSSDGKHISAQIKREPQFYSIILEGKSWQSDFLSSREFEVDDRGGVAISVQTDPLKEADTVTFMQGVWSLAFNDKAWDKKFINVYAPRISPDGEHVAAAVRVGICDYTVAVDGKVWDETFGCVWEPVYHPDGSVLIPTRAAGTWSLVRDGKPFWEGRYAQLWHQKVSPDEKRIAAVVSPKFGTWTIAVDDNPWPVVFNDAVLEPFFSQDSRHVAAVVKDNNRWTLAVDGKPWSHTFDMVWNPVFSPDGTMVATKVERDGTYAIAINDTISSQTFESLWEPVFSPDGKKLLIRAVEDGKYYRRVLSVDQIVKL